MRKYYFLITLATITLLLIQCKTVKDAYQIDELTSAIQGKWHIEYEVCCGRTSATTYGGNKSIRFNTKKFTYTIYEQNEVKQRGNYTLKTNKIGTLIQLENRFPAILRITNSQLFIDWSYMDLQREVYTK